MNRPSPDATPAPITKSLEVDRPLDEAFRLFTTDMARWWPLASHSVGGDDAEWCGIEPWEGGRVYERTAGGDEHLWGRVMTWDPSRSVTFTWHPGQAPDPATEVELRFSAITESRTRVVLIHRHWERLGDRADAVRARYLDGWDSVLGNCPGLHSGPSDRSATEDGSPA